MQLSLRNKNTPLVDLLKLASNFDGKIPASIPAHYVSWALVEHRHDRRPRSLAAQIGEAVITKTPRIPDVVPRVIHLHDLSKRVLIQTGSANWDLFLAADGVKLIAVAKPDSGCLSSYYGDKHHLLRLMNAYPSDYYFIGYSEAGLEYMSGLFCFIGSRYHAFSKDY